MLARVSLCLNCSKIKDECSLARACKSYAAACMLGFSLKCARNAALPDFKSKMTRYKSKLLDKQLLIHIVRKSTPRFTKPPGLALIRLVLTEIQRFKNVKINKEMYGHSDAVSDSVRMAIHFFVNFDIFKWLYLLGLFTPNSRSSKTWSALYDYVDQ